MLLCICCLCRTKLIWVLRANARNCIQSFILSDFDLALKYYWMTKKNKKTKQESIRNWHLMFSVPFSASRFPVSEEEEHVVRCHNVGARHLRDQVSGRYSVVLPVNVLPAVVVKSEHPEQSGTINGPDAAGSVDVDLSFGCLNTCLGAEYSLRNWNIVITLEKR